jgi:hypothetical protein
VKDVVQVSGSLFFHVTESALRSGTECMSCVSSPVRPSVRPRTPSKAGVRDDMGLIFCLKQALL